MSATRSGTISLVVAITLLALLLPVSAAPVAAQRSDDDGWEARQVRKDGVAPRDRELTATLPGRARVGYHPETGRVRFISGTPARPLTKPAAGVAAGRSQLSNADARGEARRFVDRYGALFGLRAPDRELRVRATRRHAAEPRGQATGGLVPANEAPRRGATVRFQQVRDGVEVMGAEIAVQLSADGDVLSAAGEVLPTDARAATQARITAGQARVLAATWLGRRVGRPGSVVTTTSEGLGLYDPRIMDDPALEGSGRRLVWRIDADLPATKQLPSERQLVLVDARGGGVLTSIARDTAAARRICDNRNVAGKAFACSAPFTRSEGQANTGVGDVDAAYRLIGVTREYFRSRFGRDGIDGKGGRIKATVRYCSFSGCPWRNAEWKWAQQQAIFGKGWARADDIVAHELTHGVLDAEAPLFYHYQSGAINESYADVFGELIDLSYGGGKDTASSRWKIGEDTPIGVFRDMKDPTRFGHADRVRSPRWHAGSSDDGGVHRNSGVGNKAAYLMASGGRFRGYSVRSIGRTRTARVWYRALTTRLTPAANYIDLFDALNAACTDLVGSNGMTLAHCASVRKATLATQMNVRPRKRAPARAPICSAGSGPVDVFNDDLEKPKSGTWVTSRIVGKRKGWFYPQNPNNSPAWDGTWASSGKYNFYAPNRGSRSDTTMRMRNPVALPKGAYLRFEHGYSFDRDAKRRYDGGIVEIKADGGPWRGVGGRFTHGAYNGKLAKNRGNPIGGRRAFTGASHGWSQARVDLSAYAGKRIKVRFRMGSDRSVGARGWYIDDVRIYACADDDDRPTGSLRIDGGAATTSGAKVDLDVTWDDATTWVTKLRLSGSPKMNASGSVLLKGVNLPIRSSVAWDLADTTYGGGGGRGERRVYAQVRDAAGNWSKVFGDKIEWLKP